MGMGMGMGMGMVKYCLTIFLEIVFKRFEFCFVSPAVYMVFDLLVVSVQSLFGNCFEQSGNARYFIDHGDGDGDGDGIHHGDDIPRQYSLFGSWRCSMIYISATADRSTAPCSWTLRALRIRLPFQ